MRIRFLIYSMLLLVLGCKQSVTNTNSVDYSVTVKEGTIFYNEDSIDDHLDSFEIVKTDISGARSDVTFETKYVTFFDTSKVGPSMVKFDFDGVLVDTDITIKEYVYKYIQNSRGITINKFGKIESDVVVPQEFNGMTITELDFPSFYSNKVIRTLTLPNTITRLGPIAESSTLESLIIPNSVESIDIGAFSGTNIKELTIGSGLTEIPRGAFEGSKLTSLEIPNTIKKIGINSFSENNIDNLTLNQGLIEIGSSAFSHNKLKHVELPEGLEVIGSGAFYSNDIESIVFPSTLKKIGSEAFRLNNFKTITIPDTGIIIGDKAFKSISYETKVNIPESMNNKEELIRIFGFEPIIVNGVEKEISFTSSDATTFTAYMKKIREFYAGEYSSFSSLIDSYNLKFSLDVNRYTTYVVTKDEESNYILTITDADGSTETSDADLNELLGVTE